MAIVTYYVDISDGYYVTPNALSGSDTNPFDWDMFNEYLDNAAVGDSVDERIFRIKGTRTGVSSDLVISDIEDNYNSGNRLRLIPWSDGDWWNIELSSSVWGFVNGRTGAYPVKNIEIINGRIDGETISFSVWNKPSFAADFSLHFDNSWIRSTDPGYLIFNDYHTVRYNNGTLGVNSPSSGKTLEIGDQQGGWSIYITNTILTIDYFKSGFVSPLLTANVVLDNCTFKDSAYSFDSNISVSDSSIQYSFDPPEAISASFSAVGPSELNYWETGFSAISVDGDPNYTSIGTEADVSGGRRDGIGALYFPSISASAALAQGYQTNGYTPFTYGMSAIEDSSREEASDKIFIWDDGSYTSISAGNTQSASHVYTAVGEFNPYIRFVSPHSWYSIDSNLLSAESYGKVGTASASYSVNSPSFEAGTYYVNINSSYTDSGNLGTPTDPLSWAEFLARTADAGSGENNEVYRLKGYREISTDLAVDITKGFTIDAWDISVNGPWILAVQAVSTDPDSNPTVSFVGSTIKNGVIYDIPYNGHGCHIRTSSAYNCWINENGSNSGSFAFWPSKFDMKSKLIGCTCYPAKDVIDNLDQYDYAVLRGSDGLNNLTSSADVISGDFIFEMGIRFGTDPTGNVSESLWIMADPNGTPFFKLDFRMSWWDNLARFRWYNMQITHPAPWSPNGLVRMRLTRVNRTLTFEVNTGDGWVTAGVDYWYDTELNFYLDVDGADYNGLSYLFLQADSGFPANSGQVAGEPLAVLDTYIYDDFEDDSINPFWQSDFSSGWTVNKYPAKYDIEITDSSFRNLDPAAGNYFSAAWLSLTNSLFNRASADIDSDFTMSAISESQFGFSNYPSPYPFSPSHPNYRQDADYVVSHKKQLVPFTGINTPPNPGNGYPTYPGYETGLFGYARSAYDKID